METRSAAPAGNAFIDTEILKRPIILDASNVCYNHAVKVYNLRAKDPRFLSARGLLFGLKQFLELGHKVNTFVPINYCNKTDVKNPEIFQALSRLDLLSFTPARRFLGNDADSSQNPPIPRGCNYERPGAPTPEVSDEIPGVINYDDLYIIDLAHNSGAAIISNDRFTDILQQRVEWRGTIASRTLRFRWAHNKIMLKGVLGFGKSLSMAAETLYCLPTDPTYALVRENQITKTEADRLLKEIDALLSSTEAESRVRLTVPPRTQQQRAPSQGDDSPGPDFQGNLAKFSYHAAIWKAAKEKRVENQNENESKMNEELLKTFIAPPLKTGPDAARRKKLIKVT